MNAVACLTHHRDQSAGFLSQLVGSFSRMATLEARSVERVVLKPCSQTNAELEKILSWMREKTEEMSNVAEFATNMAGHIRTSPLPAGEFLDADLEEVDRFSSLRAELSDKIHMFLDGKKEIHSISDVSRVDKLRLHEAHTRIIEAIRAVMGALESLIAAIEFHDENNVEACRRGLSFEQAVQLHSAERTEASLSTFSRLADSQLFSVPGARRAFAARFPRDS
ncbi:hypothetical protein [Lysobacter sp. GCM10012299]|uniref:hypothetical protein n=1 Tax=Lysobacter sp. GCM10012299 TaxID=3317333 RepID=UPI00360F87E1